ncbi:hypothetical protein C8Q74DRAFT_1028821 [Fomes fomentarius]|nr:hypothetical protein C8Q74DRAFT_1028821 [Fomes fomentarius]
MSAEHVQFSLENPHLLQITKYCKVASVAFALAEIISTLPDEVAFIWPNRWSIMKAVYFINKYSIILDGTLAVACALRTQDPDLCAKQFKALAYCYTAGILISEAILANRTLAIWGFHRYVKLLIIGAYIEFLMMTLYVVYQTVVYTEYPTAAILRVTGCMPSTQDRDSWPAYGCMMLAETGIIALTLLKRYLARDDDATSSGDSSVLMQTIYRDGIHFYFIVLAVSVLNVFVMLIAPRELSPSMQMPLRVVHSALCTRVLLNLRRAAAGPTGNDGDSYWGSSLGDGDSGREARV